MRSKRSREGELYIDHRASPGLTAEDVGAFGGPVVKRGEVYESAIIVCGHCQAAVILEPKRTRDRGWCSKCDAYLCDDCTELLARTLQCESIVRRLDDLRNQIERFGSSPLLFHT